MEHRDVPEGHKGLHETLYSSDGEHAAGESGGALVDDGTKVWEVADVIDAAASVAGVYAVEDGKGEVVFVGVSRDVGADLGGLVDERGSQVVCKARVKTWAFAKRTDMGRVKDEWIQEAGGEVRGNVEGWRVKRRSGGSQFEEKKFKLRKAMADATLVDEMEEAAAREGVDGDEKRKEWQNAVEGDDWSGEVDRQTRETGGKKDVVVEGKTVLEDGSIVSPFADGGSGAAVGSGAGQVLVEVVDMATVDAALDGVRPMLMADGGNISVVSVEDGATADEGKKITVMLEGACGTCPSSSTTMRMGVERALKESFGDGVGEVVAISDIAASMRREATVAFCDELLEDVRPLLAGMAVGCHVQTKSVVDGVVRLHYEGPDNLQYPIDLLLKEKLEGLVTEVVFELPAKA